MFLCFCRPLIQISGNLISFIWNFGLFFVIFSKFGWIFNVHLSRIIILHSMPFLILAVIPSEPRDVNVSFVNQSSAVITWLSPAIIGSQTPVLYDVNCKKSCEDYGKDCVDETCGSGVSYAQRGLNMTQAVITNLNSFVNYTCKIVAKNRVSEVAERKHRITASFASISFRTEGSSKSALNVGSNFFANKQGKFYLLIRY